MTAGSQTWGDRWRFAAEGNLQELQMLRDDVLHLCSVSDVPWDETLAQTEILARLAASLGEPMDVLCLSSILLLRMHHFRKIAEIELCAGADYLGAGMQEAFEARKAAGDSANGRADSYEREAKSLFLLVANGSDPDAAAILMSAVSTRADTGDDDALATLQRLMDAIPTANIRAVKAALRNIEQEQDA